jgi:hypothetical protein
MLFGDYSFTRKHVTLLAALLQTSFNKTSYVWAVLTHYPHVCHIDSPFLNEFRTREENEAVA